MTVRLTLRKVVPSQRVWVWAVPRSLAATEGIYTNIRQQPTRHETRTSPWLEIGMNVSLLSVPPGTKMFQFPGLSPYTYIFSARPPGVTRVGYPIRKSPDRRLLTTSPKRIVGSHVLHRLLVSRHPPSTLMCLDTDVDQHRFFVLTFCPPSLPPSLKFRRVKKLWRTISSALH